MDLLDLLTEQEHAADPRSEWVHVVLPSMGYACGGTILGLADGGPSGRWQLGGWGSAERWAEITCPDCRAPGPRELSRIAHRQQKPLDHDCTDECHWQTIPEEYR